MSLGRSAGNKTCDDCGQKYPGPGYFTFSQDECVTADHDAPPVRHAGCTGNLCPRCADDLLPDRLDDARRPARRALTAREPSIGVDRTSAPPFIIVPLSAVQDRMAENRRRRGPT